MDALRDRRDRRGKALIGRGGVEEGRPCMNTAGVEKTYEVPRLVKGGGGKADRIAGSVTDGTVKREKYREKQAHYGLVIAALEDTQVCEQRAKLGATKDLVRNDRKSDQFPDNSTSKRRDGQERVNALEDERAQGEVRSSAA